MDQIHLALRSTHSMSFVRPSLAPNAGALHRRPVFCRHPKTRDSRRLKLWGLVAEFSGTVRALVAAKPRTCSHSAAAEPRASKLPGLFGVLSIEPESKRKLLLGTIIALQFGHDNGPQQVFVDTIFHPDVHQRVPKCKLHPYIYIYICMHLYIYIYSIRLADKHLESNIG